MSRGLVFVLCLFGCLKEPKFTYRDAPGPPNPDGDGGITDLPEVTAATLSGAASITGEHFRMTFSATGGHGPSSLTIGGVELLGRGPNCSSERRMGLALFPSLNINDEEQPGAAIQPDLTVPAGFAGPLVAQVRVPFMHTITCSASSTDIMGVTTYTAFPDGRIVRHDDIDVTATLDSTGCPSCLGGTTDANFYLTSFATLLANDGDSVTGFDVSTLVTPNEVSVAASTFCTNYMDRQVTVSFLSDSGGDPGRRIRAVANTPRTLVFVHDIVRAAAGIAPTASRNISTTMLLGQNSSCAAAHTRASTLSSRPQVDLDEPDGLDVHAPGLNGIYGNSTLGALDRPIGPIKFKPLNTALPGGFAFWIELGNQERSTTTVTHSNPALATPSWYRTQNVGATELIIYFRDPLPVADTITITPGPVIN
ncbi:MAG: hypothetical protein M4D80_38615 [Myxococcota bacterium]|nr:hypothetical protein [Myxococcota bacterium]